MPNLRSDAPPTAWTSPARRPRCGARRRRVDDRPARPGVGGRHADPGRLHRDRPRPGGRRCRARRPHQDRSAHGGERRPDRRRGAGVAAGRAVERHRGRRRTPARDHQPHVRTGPLPSRHQRRLRRRRHRPAPRRLRDRRRAAALAEQHAPPAFAHRRRPADRPDLRLDGPAHDHRSQAAVLRRRQRRPGARQDRALHPGLRPDHQDPVSGRRPRRAGGRTGRRVPARADGPGRGASP